MIVEIGNIFDSQCHAIVNAVNCVGVMGKGIALAFKQKFPEMYADYVVRCNNNEVKPGCPYVYDDSSGKKIINFPTKSHWRLPSRISYIEEGLDWICENYGKYGLHSIAFPALGCGNGGLQWKTVGPIMYQKLSCLSIPIEIYAPSGTPRSQLSQLFLGYAKISREYA